MNDIALSTDVVQSPEFVERLVNSDDPAFVDMVARVGGASWAAVKAATLLAVYRMKKLYERYETRKAAEEATGWSSWSAWVVDLNLPISDGLVRQRCVEIDAYRNLGAEWDTILSVLAYAPTAGTDILTKVVADKSTGDLAEYVNVDKLPGGSVQGLLEAVAAIPDPGQARKLVSDVVGETQVYATYKLHTKGVLYITIIEERPDGNVIHHVKMTDRNERGEEVELTPTIADWIAMRLGATTRSP